MGGEPTVKEHSQGKGIKCKITWRLIQYTFFLLLYYFNVVHLNHMYGIKGIIINFYFSN